MLTGGLSNSTSNAIFSRHVITQNAIFVVVADTQMLKIDFNYKPVFLLDHTCAL